MEDKKYQKKNLEAIYADASRSPMYKRNPKYSKGKIADLIPYISIKDILDYKYIIKGRPRDEYFSFDSEGGEIIAEYNSIESIVNDGWRLD